MPENATPTLQPTIKVFDYLTVVPGRRPEQKVHAGIGHAKNAVHQRRTWNRGVRGYATTVDMQIYENHEGYWELLYDIPKGTTQMPWDKAN